MDPEKERIAELARRLRSGEATGVEREELALYVDDEPQLQALVKRAEADQELGGSWLARAEADARLVEAEKTPLTLAERRVGVSLMVGGGIGAFFFAPAAIGLVAGAALLTWSVLRVKVKTMDKDPYEDIEQ